MFFKVFRYEIDELLGYKNKRTGMVRILIALRGVRNFFCKLSFYGKNYIFLGHGIRPANFECS